MCQASLTPKWSRSATAATHTAFPFTGAEVREDVFLIWREMEEACSTLAQVQMLVSKFPKSNVSLKDCGGSCVCLWALCSLTSGTVSMFLTKKCITDQL